MAQRFTIDAVFRAVDQISGTMGKIAGNVNLAASSMERKLGKLNRGLAKIGGIGRAAGRGVAAGAVVAGVALAKVVSTGAEVEQTLVNAGSKFEIPIKRGTKAFDELAESAIAAASASEFSVKEAAGALDFMARAGENSAVSMDSLKTFTDLATVSGEDLATAADLASDAIGPLGLATNDLSKKSAAYTKTADLMSQTTNMANVGMQDLFESIKIGGASFRSTGQDINQFLASVALLGGEGIKGSKAGKDLARIMSRITDSSTKAQGALRKLRVSFKDKDGNIRDFLDIMTDVKAKTDKLSEVKRAQVLSNLFGANSKAAGIAVISNLEKVRKFEKKLQGADGITARLAKEQRNTALGSIKSFWSAVEAIVVRVFFVIRDDVDAIAKSMTGWARANQAVFGDKVRSTIEFFKNNMSTIVDLTPKVAALVAGLWALSAVLGALETVMGILAATTAVAAGSLLLFGVAILAGIVLIGIIIVLWDESIEVIGDYGRAMDEAVFKTTEGMKGSAKEVRKFHDELSLLEKVAFGFLHPMDTLTINIDNQATAWDGVTVAAKETWDAIVDGAKAVAHPIDTIKNLLNELGGGKKFEVSSDIAQSVAGTNAVLRSAPVEDEDFGPRVLSFPLSAPGQTITELDRATHEAFVAPQFINTMSEDIRRSFEQTMQTMKLDITLNDPSGAVQSVEQNNSEPAVTVAKSGGL